MRDLINLTEAANSQVAEYLKKQGYENLKIKGNNIGVLIQIPDGPGKVQYREDNLKRILGLLQRDMPNLGPQILKDKPSLSSVGYIAFENDPTRIIVKDTGVQGDKSAGIANEIELASMIQSVVEKYGSADVTFKDQRGKTLSIDNVSQVMASGKDVAGGKKADVVLASETQQLPVSIKKVNADTWESADSAFGKKAREIIDRLVDRGTIDLIELPSGSYKLSREVVVKPTAEEAMRAIFGTDINPQGGIVIQSFQPQHFAQQGNKIIIECHAVIKDIKDIPESHAMYWLLRNNEGRLSRSLGIRGIRPLAVVMTRAFGKRGTKDVVVVNQAGEVIKEDGNPVGRALR